MHLTKYSDYRRFSAKTFHRSFFNDQFPSLVIFEREQFIDDAAGQGQGTVGSLRGVSRSWGLGMNWPITTRGPRDPRESCETCSSQLACQHHTVATKHSEHCTMSSALCANLLYFYFTVNKYIFWKTLKQYTLISDGDILGHHVHVKSK